MNVISADQVLRNTLSHAIVHRDVWDGDPQRELPPDSIERFRCIKCDAAGVSLMRFTCPGKRIQTEGTPHV